MPRTTPRSGKARSTNSLQHLTCRKTALSIIVYPESSTVAEFCIFFHFDQFSGYCCKPVPGRTPTYAVMPAARSLTCFSSNLHVTTALLLACSRGRHLSKSAIFHFTQKFWLEFAVLLLRTDSTITIRCRKHKGIHTECLP